MRKHSFTDFLITGTPTSLFPIDRANLTGRGVLVAFFLLIIPIGVLPQNTLAQEAQPQAIEQTASQSRTTETQSSDAHPGSDAFIQFVQPGVSDQSTPPITLALQDAIERARHFDAQFRAVEMEARISHEDRMQARNAMLPSVSATTQYLNTQGNGKTPEGRFVTNDGVHVYRAWGVFHQDLSPSTYMATNLHRADAAEAVASAKAEIARRGLTVTVTKLYYALVVAQRKLGTSQQTLDQSEHFFDIAQETERLGQAAHSDVIKAEIQYSQQQQAFEETRLALENARLDLAVLLFPTFNVNFTVVDDLNASVPLPSFNEVQSMSEKANPDMRAAIESERQAHSEMLAAKAAFLPTMTVDLDYGIEANDFALRSVVKAFPEQGPLPNLGYFLTAGFSVPVWDWGTLRSKLHQAKYKEEQAHTELSQVQKEMLNNLYSYYNEAVVAREAVERTRHTSELAAESLRLINLRYQGGESTAFEAVDAQNTFIFSRGLYDDAEARYRVALANLQRLTGRF
jgi:outer membrane protein TolC